MAIIGRWDREGKGGVDLHVSYKDYHRKFLCYQSQLSFRGHSINNDRTRFLYKAVTLGTCYLRVLFPGRQSILFEYKSN